MSDKSVTKTLDWPNHRVGSRPSDPIRFEEKPYDCADSGCDCEGICSCGDCRLCEFDWDKPDEKEEVPTEFSEPHDLRPEALSVSDAVDIISRLEGTGEPYTSIEDAAEDVQKLIDSGIIYELQGSYQRLAQQFIDEGLCHPQTEKTEGDSDTRPDPDNPHGCLCCDIGACDCGDCDECDPNWTGPTKGEEDYCGLHMKTYAEHSEVENQEDTALDSMFGDVQHTEQNAPDEQLNPLSQQNVTPFSQGQYVPSGTETYSPLASKTEDIEDFGEGWGDAFLVDCGRLCCSDMDCDCDDCKGCHPIEEAKFELKDPRIEVGEDEKKPLSQSAQKIAGTDKKSIEAKSKAMPKIEVDVSDKTTILGKSGSGKTNLIKVLVTDVLKDYSFVLLDALGNFAEYEGKPNIEYHQVNPTDTAGVDEIIYAALERGNCMVVIDEVDRYETKRGTMLNELVNLGRNYGVGGIFASRRTADIDKDVLANSKFIFTFQHILPQDLDVLIDWFAQPEETFRDLQEFEAILFKDGDQVWVGKVPEKPTTTPTKKPTPPKSKSKGKGKDKDKEPEKGKEKEPETEPQEPEPDAKDKGVPKKPVSGEGGGQKPIEPPPEEEPTEEPKEKPQKSEDECPYKCEFDGKGFKYEKDWLNHLNEVHGRH